MIVFKNRILPLFQISTYKFARLISHCDVGSPPHLFESKELKLKFSKTMDPFPDRSEIRFTDLLLFICGDGMGIVHHTHSIPLSIIRGVFWSRTIPGHRFQCCSMTIFQGTSISGYPPFLLELPYIYFALWYPQVLSNLPQSSSEPLDLFNLADSYLLP